MEIKALKILTIALCAFGLLLTGCSASSTSSPSTAPAALTVYAASSLTAAAGALASEYKAQHPGTAITLAFDASSTLRAQIEQGAPADVFLSADMATPERLISDGLASASPTVFAGNALVIIIPATGSSVVGSPADLAKVGVRVIAAGDAVPITKYATQLVANLSGQSRFPADFAAKVAANIASREDNVKAVVSKIELGEGDAAIVYVTDAAASTKVHTIDVPPAANVRATYGGVVVKASRNQAAAEAFLAWVASAAGQAILARYGFLPPS